MNPRRKEPLFPDEPSQPEDIEILEVVGMGEDLGGDSEDDGEVVVAFGSSAPAGAARSPSANEADEARERLLRLRADFENLKKRVEREREEHSRHATASLVARLLPVVDNLDRAIDAARHGRGNVASLLDGVALVQRQLLDELRREGLRAVDSLGRVFDPEIHEAVATDGDSVFPANTVVEELQRGYFFEDRLLRPALVRVRIGENPSPSSDSQGEDS